ncbi:MAG: hypothetical protein AAGK01_10230 [Pseudomonadota bacterium]
MELEVLRARHGDCMLLHFESDDRPKFAIIDGGPAGVYKESLRPRLEEMREELDLSDNEPLIIELLVLSHIDDDHANGVVQMLRDMKNVQDRGDPPRYKIRRLWHNSFDDIIGNSETETRQALASQFGTASAGMQDIPDDLFEDYRDWQVLASINQGHQIREMAEALGIPANPDFGGNLIKAPDEEDDDIVDQVQLEDATLTVLGPRSKELKKLEKDHDKWLKKTGKGRESGEATLAAFKDSSVANLSSIVLLADDGEKRYLLTGDARGDKIMQAVELRDGLAEDGKLPVEILKIPHHGSNNNVAPEFFEAVPASVYVLSGDGKHGNPERDTIEWIEGANKDNPYTLHFTNPIKAIDKKRKKEYHGDDPYEEETHGVGAFLDSLPDRVTIVAPEPDED